MAFEPQEIALTRQLDVVRVDAGHPARKWLFGRRVRLSRGLCQFDSVPLEPGRSRRLSAKALELRARSVSPFDNTGCYLRLGTSHAAVWTWDEDQLKAAGVPAHNAVPESALAPVADGFHQWQGLDGVEGQYWSAGELLASRWWPGEPSARDWAIFVSGAERHVEGQVEGSAAAARLTADGDSRANDLPLPSLLSGLGAPIWAGLIAIAVAVPTMFFLAKGVAIDRQIDRLGTEIASLQEQHGSKRAQLSVAQSTAAEIDRKQAALSSPSILLALSQSVTAFDGLDIRLTSLGVSEGVLSIEFTARDGIDQVDLVSRLQDQPALSAVNIAAGTRRGSWRVSADLVSPSMVPDEAS